MIQEEIAKVLKNKLLLSLFFVLVSTMFFEINAKATNNVDQDLNNYEVLKTVTVEASAFTAECKGCTGKTAYGINLKQNPDIKLIAVDPKIIPLGTKVWVEGYGIAIAGDTGGSIKGHKIDIFVKTKKIAYNWGRKKVKIKILK